MCAVIFTTPCPLLEKEGVVVLTLYREGDFHGSAAPGHRNNRVEKDTHFLKEEGGQGGVMERLAEDQPWLGSAWTQE